MQRPASNRGWLGLCGRKFRVPTLVGGFLVTNFNGPTKVGTLNFLPQRRTWRAHFALRDLQPAVTSDTVPLQE